MESFLKLKTRNASKTSTWDLYAEKLHTKKTIWERISPVYFYFSWPMNFMIKHLHYICFLYMAIVQVQGRWPIFIIIPSYYHILLYISLAQIVFLIFFFKLYLQGFQYFSSVPYFTIYRRYQLFIKILTIFMNILFNTL